MSKTTEIRREVKNLVVTIGLGNILNKDVLKVAEKCNCSVCDVIHQINYFQYSPQAAKYRN